MKILDGKVIADQMLLELKGKIDSDLRSNPLLKRPQLDMVIVGDDFASQKYIEYKEKAAQRAGILGKIIRLPANSSRMLIIDQIKELNQDENITGFMLQLPLPDRSMEESVLERILPAKDVDGLTATNLGRLFQNSKEIKYTAPATAVAVLRLLSSYGFDENFMKSKNIVILGASKIVGLPIAAMLINAGATVTLCNEFTVNEVDHTRMADILISAVGVANLVKDDWVKEGAIVVDVGLSKDPITGLMCGDIDFENVAPKCHYISKSSGGVGPMTVASLMLNTYELWKGKLDFYAC
jgi:methylenetetrahydrofolate dehydrogenase (NADP+)/methenyltetrahydrofolate cyclohydrolase